MVDREHLLLILAVIAYGILHALHIGPIELQGYRLG
jgi:hypothetical protein